MGKRLWLAYSTDKFEETVAFYEQGLGLEAIGGWDRAVHDRGKYFALASGTIEIMATPPAGSIEHTDWRPPQGMTIGVEIDDVEAWYRQATKMQLILWLDIKDFEWGERGFSIVDPNGVVLFIFQPIG